MLRSLLWFWRSHLAVAFGCAVATAVLTGSLVVGDSMRGSLQQIALGRLGDLESVLVSPRFVRDPLADELTHSLQAKTDNSERPPFVAPAIVIPAAVRHAKSGRRHQHTTLLGVDERFFEAFDASGTEPPDFARARGQIFPSAIVNQALARQLDAAVGDEILVTFDAVSLVPRESLVGRRAEGAVESQRLTLVDILQPRAGSGPDLDRFSLDQSQSSTPTLYLPLARAQRALGQSGRANALLARGASSADLESSLQHLWTPDDLGLTLRRGATPETAVLESQRLILSEAEAAAGRAAAEQLGLDAAPILTYLANRMTVAGEPDRVVSYSTVSALDPGAGSSLLVDGDGLPIASLADDEIVLDRWAADDLGAQLGDWLELTWFEVGSHEQLTPRTASFRLAAIAALEGLAVDDSLTPPYPGMSEVDDISSWKPPFPIDFDLIRDRDEEYWDLYGAAPKAFVSSTAGRSFWAGRFGSATSLRLTAPAGSLDPTVEGRFLATLVQRLQPADLGLTFRPVRQQALEGSVGATDFSQLFLGFGFFLIAAAALLTSLLFRLGIETRRGEVGLLLAVGFPPARVQRRFLAEGAVVGLGGVVLGTLGALLFASIMLHGLKTWWLPAVGTSALTLHLQVGSLLIGAFVSSALVLATIRWTVRRLASQDPIAALTERPEDPLSAAPHSGRRWLGPALGFLGVFLLATHPWLPPSSTALVTLAAGALLLIGGVLLFADRLRRPRTSSRPLGGPTLWVLGVRNLGRQPRRSILSVAMIASACFVVSLVTAFRGSGSISSEELVHRAGGFSLWAESSLPLTRDLGDPADRGELGLGRGLGSEADDAVRLQGLAASPFRLRPGDDASCLNLYRPSEPRILGVPPQFRALNRFEFHSMLETRDNPWSWLEEQLEPGVYPAIADFASAQWILHKGLGDTIEVTTEGGEPVRLQLVALLDGSLFQSELLIAEEAFVTLFPDRAGYRFFLLETSQQGTEEVRTVLESGLERYGFDAESTADRLAAYDAIEHTYLATFQALGGLGFLLGTLGLGVVLLRNVLERRTELSALSALGFRTRTLGRAVLVENLALLLGGILLGTLAGLAAAAPELVSGYRSLPWSALVSTTAGLFAAGFLATLFAARRVRRIPPPR